MTRRFGLVGLAAMVLAVPARAQDAPPPPTPAPVAAPATALPAAPAAPPAKGLMALLCPTPEQEAAKKRKLCAKPMVQMLNSMLKPAAMLTGGMVGSFCPTGPSPDDLAQPADSPGGAASRIKKDEADAKARAADVRYLGTVDCRYYPEAQAALINALRADRSECVRIEAARSLANGCCCNRKTIAALTIAVNGSDKDGHPGERSECVRALAFLALQRCLCTYTDPEPVRPPEPPTPPAAAAAGGVQLAVFYRRVERDPSASVVADAREVVARGMNLTGGTIRQLSGQTTLADVLSEARRPAAPELRAESAAPPVAPPDPPVAVATTEPESAPRRPGTLLDVWQRAAAERPK